MKKLVNFLQVFGELFQVFGELNQKVGELFQIMGALSKFHTISKSGNILDLLVTQILACNQNFKLPFNSIKLDAWFQWHPLLPSIPGINAANIHDRGLDLCLIILSKNWHNLVKVLVPS